MRLIIKIFLPVLFIVIVNPNLVYSQENENNIQTWFDVTQFYNVGESSALCGDMGVRGIISSNDWNQYFIRPTFRYVLNHNLDFAVGMAVFYTSNANVSPPAFHPPVRKIISTYQCYS